MHRRYPLALMKHLLPFALLLISAPALAQRPTPGPDKDVGDVATQPLSDVNLKRKDVPPELTAIMANPYDLTGLRKCRQIIAAVRELHGVLGPDADEADDMSRDEKRKQSALTMAGGMIGSLIPFRFLVREISGANKAEQEYRAAIYAGVMRRSFLKGYGKARRCLPPGSPRRIKTTP